MESVTSQWLEEISNEFRQKGITNGREKARLAVEKWHKETTEKLPKDDSFDFKTVYENLNKQIEKIELYFITQSYKDRGFIDIKFAGIFYYEGDFWDIIIPTVLGISGVNIFKQLTMPREVKQKLYSDKNAMNEYISVWEDSLDYGYGINEVESKCKSDFSKELFRSANKHLLSAISLLNQKKASSKSIEDARMAVEIFLKAFLSIKENLTDEEIKKKYSHFLEKPAKHRYIAHGLLDSGILHGLNDLVDIKNRISIFPPIESRYEAIEWTFGEMWTAYKLALATGVIVLRNLTTRDTKGTLRRL